MKFKLYLYWIYRILEETSHKCTIKSSHCTMRFFLFLLVFIYDWIISIYNGCRQTSIRHGLDNFYDRKYITNDWIENEINFSVMEKSCLQYVCFIVAYPPYTQKSQKLFIKMWNVGLFSTISGHRTQKKNYIKYMMGVWNVLRTVQNIKKLNKSAHLKLS